MKLSRILCLAYLPIALISCSDDTDCCVMPEGPNLIVKFAFDPDQERLDNLGQPVGVPQGHAAQSPSITKMSAHYLELAPTAHTLLGAGEVLYKGEETDAGGATAIDFEQAHFAGDGEEFLSIPLSAIKPGNYEWVRVSLTYQEGKIQLLDQEGRELTGNLASFVGYNNYITDFDVNGSTIAVDANKKQGFWAFEAFGFTVSGQAPEGATTVPNPLFDTSPIPQGSCVVTGEFVEGLSLSGSETEDVVVTLSFSINNSFEWEEVHQDGKYEPSAGEQVVDMGLRGLIPRIE